MSSWTDKELRILRRHYADTPSAELADLLNRTLASIYGKARSLGLKKSEKFLQGSSSGRHNLIERSKPTRFKKGHNPWNAGRTGIRMSPETEFKKGHTHTCVKTGKKTKYKYIRISKAKWELLHRYVWREAHGSIPKGHIIRFKDGDTMNCKIENLQCISQKENAAANRNTEKAKATRKLMIEEGWDNGTKSLSDTYVAGLIAEGDKSLRQLILEKHPDLIELKRTQLLLNRKIKQR